MIRARPSIAEESGGEEILYPRTHFSRPFPLNYPTVQNVNDPPPVAFTSLLNKARKRTSDEFERDQAGSLITMHQRTPSGSILDDVKEERASARKHHSLGVGLPSTSKDRPRERRKDSISTSGSLTKERHSRHTSASSSSSSHGEQLHSRRVHTSDFSHLPPSPSTSSIQQFLRHVGSNGAVGASASAASHKETPSHHTPNVAHSLLRGTQEGWSDLDDQATAEALRKLDGLTSKSGARVRLSVGSLRSSRPGTPAKSGQQWEGVGSDSGKTSRRSSAHIRDSTSSTKDKDQTPNANRQGPGLGDFIDTSEQAGSIFGSSDETQLSSPAQDKPPTKKSSASMRLSYTAKRGSASSTTYTSTPTTSSRDSGSMSAGTSLTSVSAQSGRHSTSKARRNSVGSDASQSGEGGSLKDRVASLASSNDQPEAGQDVPPVPPLPKDLSTFRSPPPSSAGTSFLIEGIPTEESPRADDNEPHRSAPPAVAIAPSLSKPHSPPPHTSHSDHQGYASAPAVMKTPSKKWSLLGMKLSGSPSATKDNSGAKQSPVRQSPHSAALSQPSRRSISKDSEPWSPIQHPDAMASAASLASQSSLSSSHALSASGAPAGTPDRPFSSRPGTASSSHKSISLTAPQQTPLSPSGSIRRGSSKRLTPSAIPFFRRSSSHSVGVPRSSSPPASVSTGPSHLQPRDPVSPVDSSLSTPSGAHKKSSIISLGSLLKGSSSRRNLQSGKDDPKSDRESRRTRDTDGRKSEKEKAKKDDKDRSESRISMLMGRKRGKVELLVIRRECCTDFILCRHCPLPSQRSSSQ
jgi:dual specificity tyrosine-phosphorylation-regulated kinase 2/3/4